MSLRGLQLITLQPGTGYGDAAVELAAALHRQQVPVSWYPTRISSAELLPRERALAQLPEHRRALLAELWNRPLETDAFLLHVPPADWQLHWLRARPEARPYCYVTWEVETLPPAWPDALNGYRRVFVPSEFNRRSFMAGGVTAPVERLPHLARTLHPEASGADPDLGEARPDEILFYTISAWHARKALGDTLRAYFAAFTADDPVCFVLKTDRMDQDRLHGKAQDRIDPATRDLHLSTAVSVAKLRSAHRNPPRVHLIVSPLSPGQLDRLHARGDCYFSLTHGEGWGLGAFDAAAAGNPVIITGWSGPLDFLGQDYPYLVDHEPACTLDYEGVWFHRAADTVWAQAKHDHAVARLREVAADLPAARARVAPVAERIHRDFDPDHIGARLAARLRADA